MSEKHLNEDMLQQFALEPASCPPNVIAHLMECPECFLEATGYHQLGQALKEQPAPEFGFDLAAAVMGQLETGQGAAAPMEEVAELPPEVGGMGAPTGAAVLETPKGVVVTVREPRRISRVIVPVVIAIVAALPAWLFRRTAYFVFADVSEAIAWIILAAAGIAVVFTVYKYYRRYQQVLHLIN